MKVFKSNLPTDWHETLGSLLITPHTKAKEYTQIIRSSKKIVIQIDSLAFMMFKVIFKYTGMKFIGKTLLHSSKSYKTKFASYQSKILKKPIEIDSSTNPLISTPAEKWAFLGGALSVYAKAVHSSDAEWTSKRAREFLRNEILALQNDTRALNFIVRQQLQENNEDVEVLTHLKSRVKELNTQQNELLKALDYEELEDSILGLSNVGNTCYINSAIQPLLAIKNFSALVPNSITPKTGDTEEEIQSKKNILSAFRNFIDAYNNKENPRLLGKLIGKLRSVIFQERLQQGGFNEPSEEKSFQDVGSFLDLLLFVIGKDFKTTHSKNFSIPNSQETYLVSETLPAGSFHLKEMQASIQEKIRMAGSTKSEILQKDDALKHKDHLLTDYTETMKIIGDAPELLVFRVEKYRVKPDLDGVIDCSPLFRDAQNGSVTYELTGFAQNHNQTHWTSVVFSEGKWQLCNDSRVESINTSDPAFGVPADYIIYKKK